jgi:hypothetical protein
MSIIISHDKVKESPINISKSTVIRVLSELVEPSYFNDIEGAIKYRNTWRKCGHIFETLSKVMIATSSILSFSAGYFKSTTFGFYAGCSSTISLACVQFASYCFKESKENADDLNNLLKKINIDTVPEFHDNEKIQNKE